MFDCVDDMPDLADNSVNAQWKGMSVKVPEVVPYILFTVTMFLAGKFWFISVL